MSPQNVAAYQIYRKNECVSSKPCFVQTQLLQPEGYSRAHTSPPTLAFDLPRGRSSGLHCTAGQYCYVPLGRHLVNHVSIYECVVRQRHSLKQPINQYHTVHRNSALNIKLHYSLYTSNLFANALSRY